MQRSQCTETRVFPPVYLNTGGLRAFFFEKSPGIFRFLILCTFGNFRENKASPGNYPKFQGQKSKPMEISHDLFLIITPGNSFSFLVLIEPLNFHITTCSFLLLIFNTSCQEMMPKLRPSPHLDFFSNSSF